MPLYFFYFRKKEKLLQQSFFSKGKFLISGEYFILDGAKGLALPTQYGQKMDVVTQTNSRLIIEWKSYNVNKECWLQATFHQEHFNANEASLNFSQEQKDLLSLLKIAKSINKAFLSTPAKIEVTTYLDFANNWGLGSSATLIHNIASWAQVNAFELSDKTFGGSGYDIAVAKCGKPLIFQRNNHNPIYHTISFNPPFKQQLYFVHLNQKQNSRLGIEHYKSLQINKQEAIKKLDELTHKIIAAGTLSDFEKSINEHEKIVAHYLQLPKAKDLYFKDYWGSIKSLGAWGGDFVLATSDKDEETTKQYFQEKKFNTVVQYADMIAM